LKGESGATITAQADWLRVAINQFTGHTFNHETYELLPTYLRSLSTKGFPLRAQETRILWLQIPVPQGTPADSYLGTLTINVGGKQSIIPISLRVHPGTLPAPDVSVGFFGRMPYALNGAQDLPGIDMFRTKTNRAVLQQLHHRGFNTWSSLPRGTLRMDGEVLVYENPIANALMADARQLGFRSAFTYGGGLEEVVREHPTSPFSSLGPERFRQAAAAALRREMTTHNWLPVVFNHSDEAAGYSLKVEADLREATWLKNDYPFIRRGGFSHAIESGNYGYDLNQTFTDGSYSSITRDAAAAVAKSGKRWGTYNQSISPFSNPKNCFGQGLFIARCHGLDHHLEWYLTGSQKYPYYDLDGREYDAMMLYPRSDGSLQASIRLEWASAGLEDYRLLLLLEQEAEAAGSKGATARQWLKTNYYNVDPFLAKGRLSELHPPHRLSGQQLHATIFELLNSCR
jgi:hypothetical protein